MPKRYCPPKKMFELHIKLHGVHDNQADTVAGSFASRPKTHSFVFFPFSTNSRDTSCQLLANKVVAK